MESAVRKQGYYDCRDYDEYVIGPAESPTSVAALAVARKTGPRSADIPPLHEEIPVDTVDSLLQDARGQVCIEFEYGGYTVCTDGSVLRVAAGTTT